MRLSSTRLTVVAAAVQQLITTDAPTRLFSNGEQGVWYDPSDFNRYMQPGPELVSNGTFDNADGWTLGLGWSISNGVATKSLESPSAAMDTNISLKAGKTYLIEYNVLECNFAGTSSLTMRGNGSSSADILGAIVTTTGITSSIVTPTKNYSFIRLVVNASNSSVTVDNISIKEITSISTATLFQDSAGTTPVTAVEQPVGLMLDKSKELRLGPEIIVNGDNEEFLMGSTLLTGPSITASNGIVERSIDKAFSGTASAKFTATSSDSTNHYINFGFIPANTTVQIKGKFYLPSGSLARFAVIDTADGSLNFQVSTTVRDSWVPFSIIRQGKATNWPLSLGNNNPESLLGSSFYVDDLSIKEIPGNHAYQTTAIDRPILRNRYNLLTKTEDFSDAVWTVPAGGVTKTVDTITFAAQNNTVSQNTVTDAAPGVTAVFSVELSGSGSIYIGVSRYGSTTYEYTLIKVDLTTIPTRHTVAHTIVGSGNVGFSAFIGTGSNGTARVVTARRADLRNVDQSHLPYQRVNTATDYDSDTSKFPLYLACNGTNTWMKTNNIDFTNTNKISVLAGLRKLSDTAIGVPFCLNGDPISINGTFGAYGPTTNNGNGWLVHSRGTAITSRSIPVIAPSTNVLTFSSSIESPASLSMQIDGENTTTSTSSQGTGNYGNFPLYLFRRAGVSYPFNGNFYGLIIRGTLSTQSQIELTEKWMAKRSSVTLV